MNWDSIAAIAELLGAAGVIASLVYLAIQVNSSSKQARLVAVQSLQAQMNNVWTQMSADERVADILSRGSRGVANLELETDRLRFSALYLSLFRPYEELFHSWKNGLVDDWAWESLTNQCQSHMGNQGFRDWWNFRSDWFSKDFQDHIAEVLAKKPEYRRWDRHDPASPASRG
ncbi:MAG: hypothetical protein R3F41_12195 [Gammaproteobacteria bacterium]|nr:hypothetical protein [Pseudomonadales bacterium]MCP5348856.1 hypothetical protein [Pseudomonadales bacterium]